MKEVLNPKLCLSPTKPEFWGMTLILSLGWEPLQYVMLKDYSFKEVATWKLYLQTNLIAPTGKNSPYLFGLCSRQKRNILCVRHELVTLIFSNYVR